MVTTYLLPLLLSFIINFWTEKELLETVRSIPRTENGIAQESSVAKDATSHASKVLHKYSAESDQQDCPSSSRREGRHPPALANQQSERYHHISSSYSVKNSEITLNIPDLHVTDGTNKFNAHHVEVRKKTMSSHISL